MEERKIKEVEYYDKRARGQLKVCGGRTSAGFERFEPQKLASFQFCYKLLRDRCQGKMVLDYGCGNGIHSIFPAKMGAKKVIGIDLSKLQLLIAKERAKAEGVEDKTEFLLMDCEKMEFPDNYFDIIFDGGTFSSLELSKALPELARVLKPNGFLIGIETLGHNPFTNLKRHINKITKKRTAWAVNHIVTNKDLELAKKYLGEREVYYFHLISWSAFPFLTLPGGRFLLKLLEKIDNFLLFIFPFFKKYCFKIVFVFSEPRK